MYCTYRQLRQLQQPLKITQCQACLQVIELQGINRHSPLKNHLAITYHMPCQRRKTRGAGQDPLCAKNGPTGTARTLENCSSELGMVVKVSLLSGVYPADELTKPPLPTLPKQLRVLGLPATIEF